MFLGILSAFSSAYNIYLSLETIKNTNDNSFTFLFIYLANYSLYITAINADALYIAISYYYFLYVLYEYLLLDEFCPLFLEIV